jgi:hypothetical protein
MVSMSEVSTSLAAWVEELNHLERKMSASSMQQIILNTLVQHPPQKVSELLWLHTYQVDPCGHVNLWRGRNRLVTRERGVRP